MVRDDDFENSEDEGTPANIQFNGDGVRGNRSLKVGDSSFLESESDLNSARRLSQPVLQKLNKKNDLLKIE